MLTLLSAATIGNSHQDDDDNNEELTPPPPDTPVDSPVESPFLLPVGPSAPVEQQTVVKTNESSDEKAEAPSNPSSAPVNSLEDEIVVGTKATKKASPQPAIPDSEDVDMDDVQELPAHPKRKRVSNYSDLAEDRSESPLEEPEVEVRPRPGRPRTHGMGAVKGVTLGFWRDSPPELDKDKHSVTGFIDVRERLRTRVQPYTRDGRDITRQYPLPPGPGGSWVTFDKIAFEEQLVNLDHNQVKEYVKIRSNYSSPNETPEQKARLDAQAVKQAIQNIRDNPPPETSMGVSIAYGPEIPDQVVHRSNKKQKIFAPVRRSPTGTPTAQHHQSDYVSSTRPTRILLGYWKQSDQPNPADKHAVYGILGANDMFRVKLMKETRDGRFCQGNFPPGAGQLWIHWDEVEFEPHLKDLARPEIKEYCRARQLQIDAGEDTQDRFANETKAVWEGQKAAALLRPSLNPSGAPEPDMENTHRSLTLNGSGPSVHAQNANAPEAAPEGFPDQGHIRNPQRRDSLPHEARQTRHNSLGRPRHGLPAVELREANRRPPAPMDPIERTNSIARREIERAEAQQNRLDQHAAEREASIGSGGSGGPSNSNRVNFQDNVQRLNKVWAAQEASRLRVGAEDAKIYGGIKYERKANGPFEGKLVSQGAIITIDGEDYVEYRVLTKPSFF